MAVYNMNDFVVESKWHAFKRKAKEKAMAAVQYAAEHKEDLLIIVPMATAAITGGTKLVKSAVRGHQLRKEENLKKLWVYDRRAGAYIHLKRPLKTSDWQKINTRLNRGERMSDILQKMNMLG